RRMMRTADRRMMAFWGAAAACAVLALAMAREWNGRIHGANLRDRVLGADTAEMPAIARQVADYQRWAVPRIHQAATQTFAADSASSVSEQELRRRMNVALVLAQTEPKQLE